MGGEFTFSDKHFASVGGKLADAKAVQKLSSMLSVQAW